MCIFRWLRVLPQFYVFHSNQVIRMPINTGFLILVNDKIRMFAEEPDLVHAARQLWATVPVCWARAGMAKARSALRLSRGFRGIKGADAPFIPRSPWQPCFPACQVGADNGELNSVQALALSHFHDTQERCVTTYLSFCNAYAGLCPTPRPLPNNWISQAFQVTISLAYG